MSVPEVGLKDRRLERPPRVRRHPCFKHIYICPGTGVRGVWIILMRAAATAGTCVHVRAREHNGCMQESGRGMDERRQRGRAQRRGKRSQRRESERKRERKRERKKERKRASERARECVCYEEG